MSATVESVESVKSVARQLKNNDELGTYEILEQLKKVEDMLEKDFCRRGGRAKTKRGGGTTDDGTSIVTKLNNIVNTIKEGQLLPVSETDAPTNEKDNCRLTVLEGLPIPIKWSIMSLLDLPDIYFLLTNKPLLSMQDMVNILIESIYEEIKDVKEKEKGFEKFAKEYDHDLITDTEFRAKITNCRTTGIFHITQNLDREGGLPKVSIRIHNDAGNYGKHYPDGFRYNPNAIADPKSIPDLFIDEGIVEYMISDASKQEERKEYAQGLLQKHPKFFQYIITKLYDLIKRSTPAKFIFTYRENVTITYSLNNFMTRHLSASMSPAAWNTFLTDGYKKINAMSVRELKEKADSFVSRSNQSQSGGRPKPKKSSYEAMTVKELAMRASKRKIKGYSRMLKADLIDALRMSHKK